MVRAHRQAWCWQDEWYGLTIEDIRQLELETQLALAMKMAQFSQAEEATEANGSAPSPDKNEEVKEAIGSIETEEVVVSSGGETLQPRGVLTKQWSTSSRSSRSSKRGGESAPSYHLCMCDMLKILKADFFVLFPCDMKVLMHLPPVFFCIICLVSSFLNNLNFTGSISSAAALTWQTTDAPSVLRQFWLPYAQDPNLICPCSSPMWLSPRLFLAAMLTSQNGGHPPPKTNYSRAPITVFFKLLFGSRCF